MKSSQSGFLPYITSGGLTAVTTPNDCTIYIVLRVLRYPQRFQFRPSDIAHRKSKISFYSLLLKRGSKKSARYLWVAPLPQPIIYCRRIAIQFPSRRYFYSPGKMAS